MSGADSLLLPNPHLPSDPSLLGNILPYPITSCLLLIIQNQRPLYFPGYVEASLIWAMAANPVLLDIINAHPLVFFFESF